MKTALAACAAALLAACASVSEPGWTGADAEPFDGARAACETETQGQGEAAFEACMAAKGWTRQP